VVRVQPFFVFPVLMLFRVFPLAVYLCFHLQWVLFSARLCFSLEQRICCDSKEIYGFTMFFGDIVASFINDECLTNGKPDPIKIDPIIMIGMSYCNLKSIIGQPYSEWKKLVRGGI
jgi:hypothetical protein